MSTYQDRIPLYEKIEEIFGTKLLVFITGDRRQLETQIHSETLNYFIEHLDKIGDTEKISLLIYTRGGDTLAAWSIVNLIRQFCNKFDIIIPLKAHSAGTLISIGADNIVMTKQATLGPIDPSINTPLNPQIPGGNPNQRHPISVEAINGYLELAKELGIEDGENAVTVLDQLSTKVHPLVLGQVYRTRSQIRMLGDKLLTAHMAEADKREKVLDFLCSESGSHDYTIYRDEAKNELNLNVQKPNDDQYACIKAIYDSIASELKLTEPYNPNILMGQQASVNYSLKRALIESTVCGTHYFVSEGQLTKQQVQVANNQTQIKLQDNKSYEGWKFEAR